MLLTCDAASFGPVFASIDAAPFLTLSYLCRFLEKGEAIKYKSYYKNEYQNGLSKVRESLAKSICAEVALLKRGLILLFLFEINCGYSSGSSITSHGHGDLYGNSLIYTIYFKTSIMPY